MIDDLVFSDEAQLTNALMRIDDNDVLIFVEDHDSEYFYEELFQRLLDDSGIRLSQIFPMNGKNGVINAYRSNGNIISANGKEKPAIYLVDGDFDFCTMREQMINDNCFIYLKKYNIESYLIEQDALVKYMQGVLKCPRDICSKKLNIEHWYNNITEEAYDIFSCFAWSHIFANGCLPPNVDTARGYIDEHTGFLKPNACIDYLEKLDLKYEEVKDSIERFKVDIIKNSYDAESDIICGKFLLFSFRKYVLKNCGKNNIGTTDLILWYLVQNVSLEPFEYIKSQILRVAN